ncbi:HlyD family secretion protein [Anaerobacillus sp. HL2]|nr:HlyD family secretion protein [Anaerobacillus sp. HL2]
MCRLISDDIIIVELAISAQQLMMVEIGDKVEVQFSGQTEKIEGTVTTIALAADQSGLFKVDVEVDNVEKKV